MTGERHDAGGGDARLAYTWPVNDEQRGWATVRSLSRTDSMGDVQVITSRATVVDGHRVRPLGEPGAPTVAGPLDDNGGLPLTFCHVCRTSGVLFNHPDQPRARVLHEGLRSPCDGPIHRA